MVKSKMMKWLRKKLNEQGISLIQVMVAFGIISFASLILVKVVVDSRMNQKRLQIQRTIYDVRDSLVFNFKDQVGFSYTVQNLSNNTAFWNALRAATATSLIPVIASSTPEGFIPVQASGTLMGVFTKDETGANKRGYTEKGDSCSTFNPDPGAGNDQCPFSYRVLISAECPNYVSCRMPEITIVGRLDYNPASSTTSTLNKFRGLFKNNLGSNWSAAKYSHIGDKLTKYDFIVKRTPYSSGDSFYLSAIVPPGGANCTVSGSTLSTYRGAGVCHNSGAAGSMGAFPAFGLSSGWVKESDSGNNVTVNGGANGRFSFNRTGTFKCVAKTNAFNTRGFVAQVKNVALGTVVASNSVVATGTSKAEVRIDFLIDITPGLVGQNFELVHRCDTNQDADGSGGRPESATPECSTGFGDNTSSWEALSLMCERIDLFR